MFASRTICRASATSSIKVLRSQRFEFYCTVQMKSAAKAPAFVSYNYSDTVFCTQQWDISYALFIFSSNYCYCLSGNSGFHPLPYQLLQHAGLQIWHSIYKSSHRVSIILHLLRQYKLLIFNSLHADAETHTFEVCGLFGFLPLKAIKRLVCFL